MFTRGNIIRSLVLALGFSIIPLAINSQSAWACSTAPNAPIVKTIWGTTGGPSFTVAPAKTGDLPTNLYYAYAIMKAGKDSWEPWAPWVSTTVTSVDTTASFTPPMSDSNELITFSAYTYSPCGSSGQYQIYRKLVTNEKIAITKLDIADDLPLSVGTIPNYFFSPMAYELPQTLTSKNPAICAFDESAKVLKLISAGQCEFTISQNNEELQTPNPDLTQTINILPAPKILPDAQKDRPDEISEFQIHVVYVKLKGVKPHDYYQSGDVSNWLDLANAWMKRKINKEFIFDTYQGAYDITTMSSQYEPNDLDIKYQEGKSGSSRAGALPKLRAEFTKQNGKAPIGKSLLFIIDAKLSADYCGFADQPGDTALVTPGSDKCWYPEFGYLAQITKLNYPSVAIAHELIHNLGVGHPCSDKSDLMIGEGCEFSEGFLERNIDAKRNLYVGTAKAGANILELKVWKDGSGIRHIKSIGVCYISEPCLVSNGSWTKTQGDLQIQEKIANKWKTIQKFKIKKIATNKFAFNASIIPTTKGTHTYREYIAPTKKYSAYIGREFTKSIPY